jgi:fructosamine-3-kinase
VNIQEQLLQAKIDPSLTTESLGALGSAALGVPVTCNGFRVLTGGCWNRVIEVDTDEAPLVFKISPKTSDLALMREFDVLRYFAANTNLPVAAPYLIDQTEDRIPGTVFVMSRVPGEVMHHLYGYLDEDARSRIDDEIADYISELHALKGVGFGGVELPEKNRIDEWSDFWLPRFDEVVTRVGNGDFISEKMLDEISVVRESFPQVLAIGRSGSLTHYDIWSGNVMIDTDGAKPKVSGFIDITGFYADYAREISFMHVFGMAGESFFNRYTKQHSIDSDFALRLNVYSLRTHLQHVTMYPSEGFYKQGTLNCLRFIQDALS